MQLKKKSKIIVDSITYEFCVDFLTKNITDFKSLTPEIENQLNLWLRANENSKCIGDFDFRTQMKQLYHYDKRTHYNNINYWLRRGWSQAEAALKVSDSQGSKLKSNLQYWLNRGLSEKDALEAQSQFQGSTRKQNKENLLSKLGSEEAVERFILERDRGASHRCVEFWLAKGLSEEEANEKVAESQKRNPTQETKDKMKCSSKRSTEYWINQGFSLEEAKEKVAEHQATFSLEKCIEKYGEIEGRKCWQDRQEKWQKTLDSKSIEEQELINQKKMTSRKGSRSKISQKLFSAIHIPGARWGLKTEDNKGEMLLVSNEVRLMLDFVFNNYVIEFNGDYWHANPIKYKATDIVKKHRTQIFTAQQIWDIDANRRKLIESSGYKLLIVWEQDFRANPEATIQRCKEFLTS